MDTAFYANLGESPGCGGGDNKICLPAAIVGQGGAGHFASIV